jgi:hypothetical protein
MREKVRDAHRLLEEALCLHPSPLLLREVVVRRCARHDEDRNPRRDGILLQPIAELETVAPRELGRQQNQIESIRRRNPEPLVGVAEGSHVPRPLRKRRLERRSLGCVVLEEQNPEVRQLPDRISPSRSAR